jgi:hypothetical protein
MPVQVTATDLLRQWRQFLQDVTLELLGIEEDSGQQQQHQQHTVEDQQQPSSNPGHACGCNICHSNEWCRSSCIGGAERTGSTTSDSSSTINCARQARIVMLVHKAELLLKHVAFLSPGEGCFAVKVAISSKVTLHGGTAAPRQHSQQHVGRDNGYPTRLERCKQQKLSTVGRFGCWLPTSGCLLQWLTFLRQDGKL